MTDEAAHYVRVGREFASHDVVHQGREECVLPGGIEAVGEPRLRCQTFPEPGESGTYSSMLE
jgi:hypothetical protein